MPVGEIKPMRFNFTNGIYMCIGPLSQSTSVYTELTFYQKAILECICIRELNSEERRLEELVNDRAVHLGKVE